MSKSPSKQSIPQIFSKSLYSQQFPEGKLLLVIGEKETDSGLFNNQRILFLNTKTKLIGYSEWCPTKLPLKNIDDVKFVKKMAPIDQVEIRRCKDKLCAIEIRCKEVKKSDMKLEKRNEKWVFSFKSAAMRDEIFEGFAKGMNEAMGLASRQVVVSNIESRVENITDTKIENKVEKVENKVENKVESNIQSKNETKDIKVENTETVNQVINTKTINNTIINTTTNNVEQNRTSNNNNMRTQNVENTSKAVVEKIERKQSQAQNISDIKDTNNNIQKEVANNSQVVNKTGLENVTHTKEVVHHYHIVNNGNNNNQQQNAQMMQSGLMSPMSVQQPMQMQPIQVSQVQPYVQTVQPIQVLPMQAAPLYTTQLVQQPLQVIQPIQTSQIHQPYTQPMHHSLQQPMQQPMQQPLQQTFQSSVPSPQHSMPIPQPPRVHANLPTPPQTPPELQLPYSPIHPIQSSNPNRNPSLQQYSQSHIFQKSIKMKKQSPLKKKSSVQVKSPAYKIQPDLPKQIYTDRLHPNSTFSPPKQSNLTSRSTERNHYKQQQMPKLQSQQSSYYEEEEQEEESNFNEIIEVMNQEEFSRQNLISSKRRTVQNVQSKKPVENRKFNSSIEKAKLFFQLQNQKQQGNSNITRSKQMQNKDILFSPSSNINHLKQLKSSKLNHNYYQSYPRENTKDWNQQLYYSSNPYLTINEFQESATNAFKSIVDNITKGNISNKPTLYQHSGITFQLSYSPFSQSPSHHLTQQLRNKFQDYKYLSLFLQQTSTLRTPLTFLLSYKTITALAKAEIQSYKQLKPQQLRQQLSSLQTFTKISKSHLSQSCKFKKIVYDNKHTVVYVDDLVDLLPLIDGVKIKANLVKKYIEMNENTFWNNVLIGGFRRKEMERLLKQMDNGKRWVLSPEDLSELFEENGINEQYIGYFFAEAKKQFLKPIFLTSMVTDVALEILQQYLQQQLNLILKGRSNESRLSQITINFSRNLLQSSSNSKQQWEAILKIIKSKIRTKIDIDSIMWGFLLRSYCFKSGLEINEKAVVEREDVEIDNWIDQESVLGFKVKGKGVLYEGLEGIREVVRIVGGKEKTGKGFKELQNLLKSKELEILLSNSVLWSKICLYVASFISPTSTQKVTMNPYTLVPLQPLTHLSLQLSLLQMKHHLSHQNTSLAIQLLQSTLSTFQFWLTSHHPILSEFFDTCSAYFLMTGQNKQALTQAKSSLMNSIASLPSDDIIIAQKQYLLGNVFLACQEYQNALTNYERSKYIYSVNNASNSREYKIVELKIAELYLHFNEVNESMRIIAEVFNGSRDEEVVLQCFEKTGKVYRQLGNLGQMRNNGKLCYQCFEEEEDIGRYGRALRVGLEAGLRQLPMRRRRAIIEGVENIRTWGEKQGFEYLRKRVQIEKQKQRNRNQNRGRSTVRSRNEQEHQQTWNLLDTFINTLTEIDWNSSNNRNVGNRRSSRVSDEVMKKLRLSEYDGREDKRDDDQEKMFIKAVVSVVTPQFILDILQKDE